MLKKYTPIVILIFNVWLAHALNGQTIQHRILNIDNISVVSSQTYDYDKDGDLDIVALEYTQLQTKPLLQLVWRENDVLHHFSNKKVMALEEFPSHATSFFIQDYNKDGLADFLVVCSPTRQQAGMLLLYYAQKTGVYLRKILAQPFACNEIQHQDFNKDGLIDLIVGGSRLDYIIDKTPYYRKQVELFLFDNTKDSFAIKTLDTGGKILADWSTGDLNRDGYPDLICASGNVIQLFLNNKNGGVSRGNSITIDIGSNVPRIDESVIGHLNIIDLNNDTYPEIFWIQNSFKGSLPQFADSKNAYQIKNLDIKFLPGQALGSESFFIDINKDKLPDIVDNIKGTLHFYTQQAGGGFVPQKSLKLIQNSPVSLVDIDRDNDLDILSFYTLVGEPNTFWYENNQGQYHCHFISMDFDGYCAYQFIDIDRDQDQDIFFIGSARYRQRLMLFKSNGQGQYTNYAFEESISPVRIESMDVNQDGYADPVICTTEGTLIWMRSTGKFEPWAKTVIDSSLNSPRSLLLVDLNKDNKKDIVVGCYGDSKLVYFRNLGLGKFEKSYLDLDMPMPKEIQSADFNQDGYPDLAVLSMDSSTFIRLYLNELNGKLRKFAEFQGLFGQDFAITDLNGDKKPDLIYRAHLHRKLSFNTDEQEQKQIFALLNDFPNFGKQTLFKAEQRLHFLQPIDTEIQNQKLLAYFTARNFDRKVSYSIGKLQNGVYTAIDTQQLDGGILSFEETLPFISSSDANLKLTELLFCVHRPFQILYFQVEQKP